MENVGLYGRQASIGLHIPEAVIISVTKSSVLEGSDMVYLRLFIEDLATVGVKTVVVVCCDESVTITDSRTLKLHLESAIERVTEAGRIDFAAILINEAAIETFLSSQQNVDFAKQAQFMMLDFDGDLYAKGLLYVMKWSHFDKTPIYVDVKKAVVAKTRDIRKIPSVVVKPLNENQWNQSMDHIPVIEYLNNMVRLVAVNIASKPEMYQNSFAVNVADFMDTVVAQVYTDLGVKTRVKKG